MRARPLRDRASLAGRRARAQVDVGPTTMRRRAREYLAARHVSRGMQPPPRTFDAARRRSAFRRLARVLGAAGPAPELLPLEDAVRRLRPFERRYLGVRAIPVRQVIGTDSRGSDF